MLTHVKHILISLLIKDFRYKLACKIGWFNVGHVQLWCRIVQQFVELLNSYLLSTKCTILLELNITKLLKIKSLKNNSWRNSLCCTRHTKRIGINSNSNKMGWLCKMYSRRFHIILNWIRQYYIFWFGFQHSFHTSEKNFTSYKCHRFDLIVDFVTL